MCLAEKLTGGDASCSLVEVGVSIEAGELMKRKVPRADKSSELDVTVRR